MFGFNPLAITLGAAGVIALYVAGYIHGRASGIDRCDAAVVKAGEQRIAYYEQQLRDTRLQANLSRQATDLLVDQLTKLQGDHAILKQAIQSVPLVRTVVREGACPDVRLDDAVRVCRNAAATGDAGEIAACSSLGVPTTAATGPLPAS